MPKKVDGYGSLSRSIFKLRTDEPDEPTLFDLSENEFLDLDNPAASGFEQFQQYRDKALPKGGRIPKGKSTAKKSGHSPRKKPAASKRVIGRLKGYHSWALQRIPVERVSG